MGQSLSCESDTAGYIQRGDELPIRGCTTLGLDPMLPDTKCAQNCGRGFDRAIVCAAENKPDEYLISKGIRHFEDEVKPIQWKLSEAEQWRDEVQPKGSTFKEVMAQWRDIKDLYKIGEEINLGSYGSCSRGFCKKSGFYHSIKQVQKSDKSETVGWRGEAQLLSTMQHPNIISLADIVEDNINLYVLLEICDGGPLSSYMKDGFLFTEVQTLHMMHQVFDGLAYFHSFNYCHRDLKLDNLVLSGRPQDHPVETTNVVKIVDFRKCACIGRAGYLKVTPGSLFDNVAMPHYCPPEVFRAPGSYTTKVDMWSCGVAMYACLAGELPFQGGSAKDVQRKIYNGNFSSSGAIWAGISKDTKELVSGLLKYQVGTRLSAEQASKTDIVKHKSPAKQWN